MITKFKLFIIIGIFLAAIFSLNFLTKAESPLADSLDKIINEDRLNKTAVVSVCIRDVKTSQIIYERDASLLLHPASTLKAFTTPVILKQLGVENRVKTSLYKYKNDFYLKLSGDPLLTEEKLIKLFKKIKFVNTDRKFNSLIIDNTSIDDIPWGTGWMWDDSDNFHMPKYNAYNLNNNLVNVRVIPGKTGSQPIILLEPYFPVKIINTAITSHKNSLKIEKRPWIDPETIYISGEVSSPITKLLPVGKPEDFFIYRLKQVFKKNNIEFNGTVKKAKTPSKAVLLEEISHSVIEEISYINNKSNNLAAETLFKLAGSEYSGKTGTTSRGIETFESFYSEIGLDTSKMSIVDGSGVSHNNLIRADWMSLALSKLYKQPNFKDYLETLPVPGVKNALAGRFNDLSGNLWAKTGTLAGISGITGYLKTDSGNFYSFAILIQNYKGSSAYAKKLENKIIKMLNEF